jgi:hypothetical protein
MMRTSRTVARAALETQADLDLAAREYRSRVVASAALMPGGEIRVEEAHLLAVLRAGQEDGMLAPARKPKRRHLSRRARIDVVQESRIRG